MSDDFYQVLEDDSLEFAPLLNDIVDGGNITLDSFPPTTEQGGRLTRSTNNFLFERFVLIYRPPENFVGRDTFRYDAFAPESGQRQTGQVTFDVASVNDPPLDIEDYELSTTSTSSTLTLRAEDRDSEPRVVIRALPIGSAIFSSEGIEISTVPFTLPNRDIIYEGDRGTSGVLQYYVIDEEGQRSSTITVLVNVDSPENTAAIVGGVLSSLIFCLIVGVLVALWFARKPLASLQAKKAMEELLLQHPYILQRSINGLLPTDEWPILTPALFWFYGPKNQITSFLQVLVSEQIESLHDETLAFRNNSLTTRIMSDFARLIGRKFLKSSFEPTLSQVIKMDQALEIDPNRIANPEALESNKENFRHLLVQFFDNVQKAVTEMPCEFHEICIVLHEEMEKKWPGSGSRAIVSFLFLRYLSPAINNPTSFALCKLTPTPEQARTLLLISKVFQTWANQSSFKEPFLQPLQQVIDQYDLSHLVQSAITVSGSIGSIRWSQTEESKAFETLHGYAWKFTDVLYGLEE